MATNQHMKNTDSITQRIKRFYESCSFPGYDDCDSIYSLREKAKKSIYAEMLDNQIPTSVDVLDVGCGTGQLSIFLSLKDRRVTGIDLSRNSLTKGINFRDRFGLGNVTFIQMDIFNMCFNDSVFDYTFCMGVLHHTFDAKAGFKEICRVTKNGGYVVVGLYNKYGRLPLYLRKTVFRLTRNRLLWLDYFIRNQTMDEQKKKIWFADQYQNPHETTHTVDEVLGWFSDNNIEYINSYPKINGDSMYIGERVFQRHNTGSKLSHVMAQLSWMLSQSREGGFFVLIGKKK